MIKGVIFDMDGLMFDTERIWATLWKPALATLGLPYKEGLDAAARGSAGDSMRAVLRRFYGPDCDTDAIMDALHAQAETAFQAPPPKKPGLDELSSSLRPSPTRRSSSPRPRRWAPSRLKRWCWRTATTACAPVRGAALSP